MTRSDKTSEFKRTIPWQLAVIFILFTTGIIISGSVFFNSQRKRIFNENKNNLAAISLLKTRQIEQWYHERLGDAAVIKDNEPLIRCIKQYFVNDNQQGIRRELTKWIGSVIDEYDYDGVSVIDTLLKTRLDVSGSDSVKTNAIRNSISDILKTPSVVITDLHRAAPGGKTHMDVLIPLTEPETLNNKPFAVIILRINPEKVLFPLIQSWPTPSKSSETLLVRREGDSVLYLNALRHSQNTALNFKFPVSDSTLPASMAVRGYEGLFEGFDYRKIPVISYITRVPVLNWYMVAKVDKEELEAPLKRYLYITVIVIILLILINASIFGFWIWQQRVKFYRSQLANEIQRRQAEEILRETNEYLTNLFNYANAPIIVWNTSLIITQFNPAFEVLSGYGKEEVVGKRIDILFNEENTEASLNLIESALKGKRWETVEIEIQRKDGGKRIVLWNSANIVDSDGKAVIETIAQGYDITKRKKAEEDLRESENRFRQTFDLSPVGVVMVDLDKKFLRCNDSFSHSLGYLSEELVGKAIADVTIPDDINLGMDEMMSIMKGEIESFRVQKRYLRKDGQIVWGEVLISLVRNHNEIPQYFLAIIQDITNRKIAEEYQSIQKRIGNIFLMVPDDEMFYEVLKVILDLMQSPFGVFGYIDENGSLVVPTMTRQIWDKCNVPEKTIIFPKDTWGNTSWPRAIREKKPNYSNDISIKTPEGHVPLTRHISFPIVFKEEVIGLFQVANKVTDYTETDIAILDSISTYIAPILSARLLRESSQKSLSVLANRQDAILSSVPDIIMEVDINKVYTWANKSGFEFFGDDVIGREADFYFEGDQETYQLVQPLFNGGGNTIYIESWQRRKDGEKRLLAWWCRVLKDLNGKVTGALSSALDITERITTESQIRKLNEELEERVIKRTEQLEAANKELEAFSYSVSHDLRAPLRSVHSFTKILVEEYNDKLDDEGKRLCGIISSGAAQMGELIDDLLSFSRIGRSSLLPGLLDMQSIASSVFIDLAGENEKEIIKFKLGDLHKAYGDANLIRLVWNNLISNAIKYSSKESAPEIIIRSKLDGNFITYSINDNGVGFEMQYVHKLFGVFQRLHSGSEFEGNGVGLAIVQRIITKHNGKVWAEGDVGKGATFYFSLPADA